ncbi:MAG TPA: hypothetical protein PLL78_13025 [Fimbriimonadaceae bacterium]|nr:hypothetical protein [Fimbriimonadaceae bacterium]HRJ97599.1 hypothetical protein [Fimbriimonadaceae bacterium]
MADDADALEEACRRIIAYGHGDPREWMAGLELATPSRSFANLGRLIETSANPDTRIRLLSSHPPLAQKLLILLGAGRRLPDALLQNPELADWIVDPERPAHPPESELIEAEARRQVAAAHSYSHRLDRLRYVKQKWNLAIALADLERAWNPQEVWSALSDLASALLRVVRDVAWQHYRDDRSLGEVECPIVPIAMGKLGGDELNYSSDVDLLFVLDDEADEALEKHALRYCESLRKAIDEPMGRGSLFRVDLRLRPYGGAGPIASRWRALETYYRLYSEPWEQLALIRSKPLDPGTEERWRRLREEICFRPSRGEWFFEEIVAMRERTESFSEPEDLKRGPGGIRDVEMLVQALQALGGNTHACLRGRSTLQVLHELLALGMLSDDDAAALEGGYVLLRQVEHRSQILDDRQTHRLPSDEADRRYVAQTLGFATTDELVAALDGHRRTIRAIYERLFPASAGRTSRSLDGFDVWLRRSPSPESLRELIAAGGPGCERLARLAEEAPVLVDRVAGDAALTELILTGEIEEAVDVAERFRQAGDLGRAAGALFAIWATQRVLSGRAAFDLSEVFDSQIAETCRRAEIDLDIVAMGSYAGRSLGYASDADVILLAPPGSVHSEAETAAERLLAEVETQHRAGSPLVLDLRLRPEGRKGSLVIPEGGLQAYSRSAMEWWERFALGRARLVIGNPRALAAVEEAAYDLPLDSAALTELLAMKERIESERVSPGEGAGSIKLGPGGMADLEWAIQLLVARHLQQEPPREPELFARIAILTQKGFIDPILARRLRAAWEELDRRRFFQAVALGGAGVSPGQNGPPDAESISDLIRGFYEDTVASLSA